MYKIILILFIISSCNFFEEKIGVGTLPTNIKNSSNINFLITNHLRVSNTFKSDIFDKYIKIAKTQLGDSLIHIDLGGIESETYKKNEYSFNYILFNANSDPASYTNEPGLINSNVKNVLFNLPILNEKSEPQYIIKKDDLEIGLLGMNIYNEKHSKKINGIIFEDPTLNILKNKDNLKDINILALNIITHCQNLNQSYSMSSIDNSKNQIKCPENKTDNLEKTIKKIPPDLINIIITQSNFPFTGFIDETPVIGIPKNSPFIGIFSINKNSKEMRIYSPIKTCKYFARASMTCIDDPDEIPASFLGKKVY